MISEKDFAELLIAYAGFPPKKKVKMLKRVRKAFKVAAPSSEEGEGGGEGEEANKSPGENALSNLGYIHAGCPDSNVDVRYLLLMSN